MKNTCEWKHTHIFPNEYLVSSEGKVTLGVIAAVIMISKVREYQKGAEE